jgi:hypothetical protein
MDSSVMKILIAVLSCHKNRSYHDIILHSWGSDLFGAELKFFLGLPETSTSANEIILNVEDDYDHLPSKCQAMLVWAFNTGFDYVFKCDTDTFVTMDRLLKSGFERHDYVGRAHLTSDRMPYAYGGAGYWVSKKSINALLKVSREDFQKINGAEDVTVALFLAKAGIPLINDDRYMPSTKDGEPKFENNLITTHGCSPEKIQILHSEYTGKVIPSLFEYYKHYLGDSICNDSESLIKLVNNENVSLAKRRICALILDARGVKGRPWDQVQDILKGRPEWGRGLQ